MGTVMALIVGKVWSRTRCVYEGGDNTQGRGDQPCPMDEKVYSAVQCHIPFLSMGDCIDDRGPLRL